jgi:hypothetical protein
MSDDRLIIVGVCGSVYLEDGLRLGSAGSGKDAFADQACIEFGFMKIGLGDGVKSSFDDIDQRERSLTKELGENGISTRNAWQVLGTECRHRSQNKTLWSSLAIAKISYLAFQHPVRRTRFIIPDMRFLEEQQEFLRWCALENAVFCLVEVRRTLKNASRSYNVKEGMHSSETETKKLKPTIVVENIGGLSELHRLSSTVISGLIHDPSECERWMQVASQSEETKS